MDHDHSTSRRNQFILGPRIPEKYQSWPRCEVDEGIWLASHPMVGIHHATGPDCSLTVIGYILDPSRPESSDQTLANHLINPLLDGFGAFETEGLAGLGGRWIVFAQKADESRLYTDTLGLRQVVYSVRSDGKEIWSASQADTIAEIFGDTPNPEALIFLATWDKRSSREYWWPGDATMFDSVRHLLPNHYLCLRTGQVKRYWPRAGIPRLDRVTAAHRSAEILRGTMAAANQRFDLTLLLTAGWDSRILLAACREIRQDIVSMTLKKATMPSSHQDLAVPTALTKNFGLQYDVITSPEEPSEPFRKAICEHVPLAHPVWMSDLEACRNYFGQQRAAIHSGGSEVAKCFYRLPKLATPFLTPGRIAMMTNMLGDPFAMEHFGQWLGDASTAASGIDLRDLLYWEQRAGRWLPSSLLESDVAWAEVVAPFNHRELLVTLLGAPDSDRKGPSRHLYQTLIEHLWPETLSEPINPDKIVPDPPDRSIFQWRSEVGAALGVYKNDLKNWLKS